MIDVEQTAAVMVWYASARVHSAQRMCSSCHTFSATTIDCIPYKIGNVGEETHNKYITFENGFLRSVCISMK